MKRLAAMLLVYLGQALTAPAVGADWRFGERIAVSAPPAAGVYHHLDGAGRKHLALAGDRVGAAWEDNRDGSPQVYFARYLPAAGAFGESIRLSDADEAWEPALGGLGDGRFVAAWEQQGGVYLRLIERGATGPLVQLDRGPEAGHVTLAVHGGDVFAAWRTRRPSGWYLRVARVEVGPGVAALVATVVDVEGEGRSTPVQMPTLSAQDGGLCVAWEDRRAGHTRLLTSFSADGGRSFSAPGNLNEFYSGRNAYDKGNGATRVSMAPFGSDEVVAAWMDKRRGGSGYGIFAALAADSGAVFGPDERVHGDEGDRLPHYNPATAGNAGGRFVVAWDDYRRGDLDVWLSEYGDDLEWGADLAPAPASGAGEQSHPSIALAADGALHLLWVERAEPDAPTRLWYAVARDADRSLVGRAAQPWPRPARMISAARRQSFSPTSRWVTMRIP